MVCAFVGVGVECFGKEARGASLLSGPDRVGRLMTTRVRLGSGLMGRLAISSSVSRRSVAPIPSSSLLPRRFLRATCGSDFGTGNALLGLGFGWLAAELFDWLLGRDRSVGVGAELLVADGGRARVLRRDADDGDEVAVAEGGRAADLGEFAEFAALLPVTLVAFVFIVLVVNFGAVRLQIYTYIEPGKRRSDEGD